MQPASPPPPAAEGRPSRVGVLLRVGIFAFLEIAGLAILSPLMYPLAGYLVSAALGTFAAAAIANTIAIRVYERGNLSYVGLGWTQASCRNLWLGIAAGAGAALLVLVPPLLTGAAHLRPAQDWDFSPVSIAFLAIVLLFGAIGEELLFRGYGFQVLLGVAGEYATILPMSVLFGLAHSNNQNASNLGLANTMLWGLLFGLAFLRSRDLWLPIGLHYGWNVTLPLFGVNLSGFTMKVTGYSMEWNVSALWSGGEYGPEAGLLTTAVLALLFYGLGKAPVVRQHSHFYQPED
ncbi:MAG: CPBP family intramembrane metalloprotease [Bryobacterales bacterium]|nr:CPBP family intramembrane metalloprotease [Bryobacterales bacterium]